MLAFALTARLSSPDRVSELGDDLAALLPAELGAPDAVSRLVDAGIGLSPLGGLLALLPMSLYGEGLRRALLRFSHRREGLTGWRGRLAALPVLLIAPVLLYPLLLTVPVMADLAETGGVGATLGRVAVGFYAVLAALTIPLAWGFRVVGAGRVGWSALAAGRAVHRGLPLRLPPGLRALPGPAARPGGALRWARRRRWRGRRRPVVVPAAPGRARAAGWPPSPSTTCCVRRSAARARGNVR